MVNCNPETVSTDYDTSDRLFFEPLTDEDVLQRLRRAAGRAAASSRGVIVEPRRPDAAEARARARSARASRSSAPAPTSIDLAEDRERFNALCDRLGIPQPDGGIATTADEARRGRDARSATRCSSGRRTCSAAARCRSSTTTPTCAARWPSSPRTGSLGREGGLSAERPALDRPLPRGRDRGRRRRAARPHRRGAHRRGHGAHRGGGRALGRLRVRDPAADAVGRRCCDDRGAHRARWPTRSTSSACSTCSTR